MGIFRNGEQWQEGESNICVGMLLLGKITMSTQGRMTVSFYLIAKYVTNSERFNLVKQGLFTNGFFGYKFGQAFQLY
jgi:hypothetical protein